MIKVPSNIAIGSDIELFLFDNDQNKVVPCVGVLEGTKDAPYVPEGYSDGFAIQEDNVMVEYNIPPASTYTQFYKSMRTGRFMVLEELKKRHGTKYGLYTKSHVHKFQARDLTSRQAKLIGCEPDCDAYEGGATRRHPPAPGLDRSCGGHIHLGGDFKCPDFVAALFAELFIGLRGQTFSKAPDLRAKWYGKPGIFRSKPYGIEYRTPNNSWGMSGSSMEIVGDVGLRCARYLTETNAVTLQKAFRNIPWVKVRAYMVGNKKLTSSKQLYTEVLDATQAAGVPL